MSADILLPVLHHCFYSHKSWFTGIIDTLKKKKICELKLWEFIFVYKDEDRGTEIILHEKC